MGVYSIKAGDNLWNIVKKEFKLNNTNEIAKKVDEIAMKNNIKNPDSIFAGQKINLGNDLTQTPLINATNDIKPLNVTPITFDFSKEKTFGFLAKKPLTPKEISILSENQQDPKAHGPNPGENMYVPEKKLMDAKADNETTDTVKRKRYSEDNPSFFAKNLKFDTAFERMNAIIKENEEEQFILPGHKEPENIDDIKSIMKEIELKEPEFDPSSEISKPAVKTRKVKGGTISAPVKRTENTEETAEIKTEKTTKKRTKQLSLHAIDVTTKYTGTAEQLNKHLKGVLKGKGAHLLRLQELYGINAAFLAAIAINESANGTSYSARKRNNVGGVRKAGSTKFKVYVNVEACLDDMASFLKRNYIDKGRTTIGKVGAKYCPTSDHTDKSGINQYWPRNVGTYMAQIDPTVRQTV